LSGDYLPHLRPDLPQAQSKPLKPAVGSVKNAGGVEAESFNS
jgi:hypothetical protein